MKKSKQCYALFSLAKAGMAHILEKHLVYIGCQAEPENKFTSAHSSLHPFLQQTRRSCLSLVGGCDKATLVCPQLL